MAKGREIFRQQAMTLDKKRRQVTVTDLEVEITGDGTQWVMPLERLLPVSVGKWETNAIFHRWFYVVELDVEGGARSGHAVRSRSEGEAHQLAAAINTARERRAADPGIAHPTVEIGSDPVVAMRHLEALREAGLVTEEEYQAKRGEILERL